MASEYSSSVPLGHFPDVLIDITSSLLPPLGVKKVFKTFPNKQALEQLIKTHWSTLGWWYDPQ